MASFWEVWSDYKDNYDAWFFGIKGEKGGFLRDLTHKFADLVEEPSFKNCFKVSRKAWGSGFAALTMTVPASIDAGLRLGGGTTIYTAKNAQILTFATLGAFPIAIGGVACCVGIARGVAVGTAYSLGSLALAAITTVPAILNSPFRLFDSKKQPSRMESYDKKQHDTHHSKASSQHSEKTNHGTAISPVQHYKLNQGNNRTGPRSH